MKKVIVFSAINVTQGGPLTILKSFADYAAKKLSAEYEIIFLLKTKTLLPDYDFQIIEFPKSQKTFFHKLYFEYFGFRRLSRKLDAYLWFSLNDCSPVVSAKIQSVYFHNATPFYKITGMDFRFPSRVLLQKFYYYFFYRINIRANDFIVVQQHFFKTYVHKTFNISEEKILIHRPHTSMDKLPFVNSAMRTNQVASFFYPTKAEVYKNIHIIIKAIELVKKSNDKSFKLILTISGTENKYSRWIKKLASAHPEIEFIGYVDFQTLVNNYINCSCLLFPSKLETWGLPLSEARYFGKSIIAADLPYAHETLNGYDNVLYVNADSASDLAKSMATCIDNFYNTVALNAPHQNKLEEGGHTFDNLFNRILR